MHDRYARVNGVVARQVAGELVLVRTAGDGAGPAGDFFVLNGAGELLWSALEGGATAPQLARRLTEEWEVDPETAEADARAFLEAASAFGVVRRTAGGEAEEAGRGG